MTKKQIAALVTESYTKDKLDEKKVEHIASLISRKDLKKYLRGLKLAEKSRTVSLVLPDANVYNNSEKLLQGVFQGKRIIVEEDPSLLLGMKVIDNDTVYDMSLKNNLETFTQEVAQ